MLKRSLLSLVLIGAGAIGFSAVPASAVIVPVQNQAVTQDAAGNLAVKVADRRVNRDRNIRRDNRRVTRYDRRRHGPRCARWSNNCRHYYRGYYYGSPWWTFPLVGTGIVIGSTLGSPYVHRPYRYRNYSSRHVQWCYNRYRSYNSRNNTWISYSGDVRQCYSPYGP